MAAYHNHDFLQAWFHIILMYAIAYSNFKHKMNIFVIQSEDTETLKTSHLFSQFLF